MKRIYLLTLLSMFLFSCGGTKNTASKKSNRTQTIRTLTKAPDKKLNNIVSFAETFEGTRYKFGGTTRSGMDCSGLVLTAFESENIALPRISREMATRGKRITLAKADKGDLVFFQTNKNRRVINHVGLITKAKGGEVLFIHSTSSRGVIVSSLDERYWKAAFVEIRRII